MSASSAAAAGTRPEGAGALLGRLLRLGADPSDSAELRARKAMLLAMAAMVLPAGVLWGALYWSFGEPLAAFVPWGYTVASIATIAVFARTRSYAFFRTVELALILLLPAMLLVVLGGVTASGGVVLWSLLAPLGAIVFEGPRRARWWFVGFLCLLVGSLSLAPLVRPDPAALPDALVVAFGALNIGGVSLVAFALLTAFALQRESAQQRVEGLLLNILPEEIARRLQEEPQAIADHFEQASILFADVVDFTPMSSRMHPGELVGILDRLFTAFDDLADRHGVEKIKTIGDCYMVAAGVPQQRPDHAHALARVALEMHECAAGCLPAGETKDLRLRIGISSGPVVAGVIGRRRFLYDLWGDTVNMASRMESHGRPGEIQITRPTWELLREDFDCELRGAVEVKGKGPVECWTLLRPTAASATAT